MPDETRPGAGDEPAPPGTLTSLIEEVVRSAASGGGYASGDGSLAAGVEIGRYRLVRVVGRGAFGVVWEARDRDLGRAVALKVLRAAGEGSREKRLVAEAEVAARLSHPNIVTVLDVGRGEHGVHLVQEFLSGQTLAARLLAAGHLPLREALRIAVEICKGLAHAHAHGVVHRDLTPRNVQLCDDGQVKLLDLGMASALGRRKLDGGTPEYMAPEQADAAPEDERTDVFAVGVMLCRMLTGASPTSGTGSGGRGRAWRGISVPEAPALARLVEACLARSPTERPRDAGVVLRELQAIATELPRDMPDRAGRARLRAPPRLRWAAIGAAGALLTVLAVAAGVRAAQGVAPAPPPAELILGASARTAPCTWKLLSWQQLTAAPEGAIIRNGKLKGQGIESVEGISAWLERSDWNQLFVPVGAVPDTFAVEAEFLAPALQGFPRMATFMVFTDPADGDESDVVHGSGLRVGQGPARAPYFEWGVLDGLNTQRITYGGTLPGPITGGWRKVRIEGSRSRCWLRAQLDLTPLLTAVGRCDLGGRYVMLGAEGGEYQSVDIAWRNLRIFEGSPGCQ